MGRRRGSECTVSVFPHVGWFNVVSVMRFPRFNQYVGGTESGNNDVSSCKGDRYIRP